MKWFSILKLSFRILIVHHIWNAQLPLILATVLRLSVWYFWIYNFIRIRIEQSECGLITVFLLFQLKIESPHCIRETRTHCSKWKVISRMKFQKQIGIFSLIFFFSIMKQAVIDVQEKSFQKCIFQFSISNIG